LKWSAQELADRTGMNWRTIQRLESEKGFPASRTKNLLKIRYVLEDAGVIFIDENGGGPGGAVKGSRIWPIISVWSEPFCGGLDAAWQTSGSTNGPNRVLPPPIYTLKVGRCR
jgi:hypothetical protein